MLDTEEGKTMNHLETPHPLKHLEYDSDVSSFPFFYTNFYEINNGW